MTYHSKPVAFTTYRDAKKRLWVITQLFYSSMEPDADLVGLNIYQVGTNAGFQYVEIDTWNTLIENRSFVKDVRV